MIEDRYEIIKLIQKDYIGGLYEAVDHQLKTKVTVRRFFTESSLINSPELSKAFVKLGQEFVKINHPNISKIHHALIDEDGPYFVTPLHISTNPESLTAPQAYRLLHAILQGLKAIHQAGFVHGSLQPTSISFAPKSDYPAQITDFGLSQLLPLIRDSETSPGQYIPASYIAPELCHDYNPTAKSDLYALAKICQNLTNSTNSTKLFQPWLDKAGHKNPKKRATIPQAIELLEQLESKIIPHQSNQPLLVTQKLIPSKKPKRKKHIAIGAVTGSILASSLYFVTQNTSSKPSEITQNLDIPAYQHFPHRKKKRFKGDPNNLQNLKVFRQQLFNSPKVKQLGNLSSKLGKVYYQSHLSSELDFTASGYTTKSGTFEIKDQSILISGLSKHSKRSRIHFNHSASATLRFETVNLANRKNATFKMQLNALQPFRTNSKDHVVIRLKLSNTRMVTLLDSRKFKKIKPKQHQILYQIPPTEGSAQLYIDILSYGKGHGFTVSNIQFLAQSKKES